MLYGMHPCKADVHALLLFTHPAVSSLQWGGSSGSEMLTGSLKAEVVLLANVEPVQNEWHKLFWPERPEVIRMAARFGATFIPMCAVGEDEIYEVSIWTTHCPLQISTEERNLFKK